ncbi:MAG: ribbon-helix-helix protein, CopG family [Candidatus Kapabacteria bacterium]|nr:ribbon-helix-helix protein, CopG family [Candidatus Kapabacteria bacterium]
MNNMKLEIKESLAKSTFTVELDDEHRNKLLQLTKKMNVKNKSEVIRKLIRLAYEQNITNKG